MAKLSIAIATTVCSSLFWFIGNLVSNDVGFLASIVGGLVGLVVAVKWCAQYT
ncbi:MAG: hypothetical protein P1V20_13985 [Verrucomicrobiales bacterium]|nr:hypothetical protein [Verrucomicrobiales bacterium]